MNIISILYIFYFVWIVIAIVVVVYALRRIIKHGSSVNNKKNDTGTIIPRSSNENDWVDVIARNVINIKENYPSMVNNTENNILEKQIYDISLLPVQKQQEIKKYLDSFMEKDNGKTTSVVPKSHKKPHNTYYPARLNKLNEYKPNYNKKPDPTNIIQDEKLLLRN
jgi:hypothetical protein